MTVRHRPCLGGRRLGDQFTEQCRRTRGLPATPGHGDVCRRRIRRRGSLPYATTEYETPDTERDARSYVMVVDPAYRTHRIVVLHTESTCLTSRTREPGKGRCGSARSREPSQTRSRASRGTADHRGNRAPPAGAPSCRPTPGSFRTNLRDVLPERQAETFFWRSGSNTGDIGSCCQPAPRVRTGQNGQYEARVGADGNGSEVLVVLRDRFRRAVDSCNSRTAKASRRPSRCVQENLSRTHVP